MNITSNPVLIAPQLVPAQTIARLLGLSPRSVYNLANSGELPGCVRIGSSWRFNLQKIAAAYGLEATATEGGQAR